MSSSDGSQPDAPESLEALLDRVGERVPGAHIEVSGLTAPGDSGVRDRETWAIVSLVEGRRAWRLAHVLRALLAEVTQDDGGE